MSELSPVKGRASAIGAHVPLIDGIEKVTGRAKYTADLGHADALVGRIYRSPYPHARIIKVHTDKALALPGVIAIVTGDDCDVPFGVLPIAQNEFPMARDRVRYRGEPVAAVAARDETTAEAALALIEMEVEELPAYFDPAKAREPGAVDLHEDATSITNSAMPRRASPPPISCARGPTPVAR
jgi:4-hydroxybenzoyl-CoA reductase subunit alpha